MLFPSLLAAATLASQASAFLIPLEMSEAAKHDDHRSALEVDPKTRPILLECAGCYFDTPEDHQDEYAAHPENALALNFTVNDDENSLYLNGQKIYPMDSPFAVNIFAPLVREANGIQSPPIHLGFALEYLPFDETKDVSMIPIHFTVVDLDGLPVKLPTIAIDLLKLPTQELILGRSHPVPFHEIPGADCETSFCRAKAIALAHLREMLESARGHAGKFGMKGCPGKMGHKGHKGHKEHKGQEPEMGEMDHFRGHHGHGKKPMDGEMGEMGEMEHFRGHHGHGKKPMDGEMDEMDHFRGHHGHGKQPMEEDSDMDEMDHHRGHHGHGKKPMDQDGEFPPMDDEDTPDRQPGRMPGHIRPHGGFRHHDHPPHRHHHSRVQRFIHKAVHLFLIPALLGVIGGLTASAIGMFIGQSIVFLWFRFVRGGQRGSATSSRNEVANDEEKIALVAEDEEDDSPPVYEASRVIIVTDEKN